jgi:hypothetical protein|tara:strand:+ start:2727 stop:2840 length:114 start_codon:yes stop_codon:yes gene_type:complete
MKPDDDLANARAWILGHWFPIIGVAVPVALAALMVWG